MYKSTGIYSVVDMRSLRVAIGCLLLVQLSAIRSVSGHAIELDPHVANNESAPPPDLGTGDGKRAKGLDLESLFSGFAKSMISRTSSSQMLSLNLSNVVLMLLLKGLIWGASYMQGGGEKGRKEDPSSIGALFRDDVITETDVLLFLGYLVADESGQYDCLNRVACEQPARAENYLRSAEMVWKTAKMLDGVIPLDAKYEKTLIKLQEAIEDGRANGDCEAKYKCSESTSTIKDNFDPI